MVGSWGEVRSVTISFSWFKSPDNTLAHTSEVLVMKNICEFPFVVVAVVVDLPILEFLSRVRAVVINGRRSRDKNNKLLCSTFSSCTLKCFFVKKVLKCFLV